MKGDDQLYVISVLEWRSGRIKRVVRSTLSAEAWEEAGLWRPHPHPLFFNDDVAVRSRREPQSRELSEWSRADEWALGGSRCVEARAAHARPLCALCRL